MSNVFNGFRQADNDGNNEMFINGVVDLNGDTLSAEQFNPLLQKSAPMK